MARQTITRLVDDLDGGEAHETVKFGLDGTTYEIDLSTKNAHKLRRELAIYVEKGSRISERTAPRPRGAGVRGSAAGIREWAQRKGYPVASRGRIGQEILELYRRGAGG